MEFLTDPKFVAIVTTILFLMSETLPAFNVKPNSVTQVIVSILKFLVGKSDKE